MKAEGTVKKENFINDENEQIMENDPIEAIFALNLGDFLTEDLISKELSQKINSSARDKTAKLKNQLKELITIYSFDKALTILGFKSSDDFILYNAIAKTVTQMLNLDACHIYLSSDTLKDINNKTEFELFLAGSSTSNLKCSEFKTVGLSLDKENNPLVKAFLENETIYLKNTKKSENWQPEKTLNQQKTETVLTVPIADRAQTIGVFCLESYTEKEIHDGYIKLIQSMANLFVTSSRLQKLIEETEEAINKPDTSIEELRHLRTELTQNIGDLGDGQQLFVESLAEAVDSKSKYTHNHSKNVANLAKEICEHLELNEKTTDLIYYAGLLHNIGKITISEDIFSKKDISDEEWQELQSHPNIGVSLLMKINFLSEIIPYVNYHRERWDGCGEPEGLSGMSIPLGSRIIGLADAYQALVSQRSYRDSLSQEKALDIINKESGIKWDPAIVKALIEIKS